MKNIKRTLALLLLFCLAVSLIGCQSAPLNVNRGHLLVDGNETRPDWVVKVGDREVSFSLYRYFFKNVQLDMSMGLEGFFDGDEKKETEAKETALTYLKEFYALEALAAKHGISLSDAERKTIHDEQAAERAELGDELYAQMLNDYYLTEDIYLSLLEYYALFDKTYEHFIGEGGKIHVSDEALLKHLDENYLCYAQIYLDFQKGEGTNVHDKTDNLVAAVMERLESGESFFNVVFAHSDDQTMMDYRNGYLTKRDALSEEKLEVLDNLKEGEISEPLLRSDGYYIFLAMPLSEAVIEENREFILNGYTDVNGVHTTGLYEELFYDMIHEESQTLTVSFADCYEDISTESLF